MEPPSVPGSVYPSLGTSFNRGNMSSAPDSHHPSIPQELPNPSHSSTATVTPSPIYHLPESLPPRAEIKCLPDKALSKDEIRDAVIQYSKNCVFTTKDMIQDMEIKDVVTTSVYQYTLSTFTETREVRKKDKPYDGRKLETTASDGTPPGIWEIPQTPPEMFENAVKKSEIPHTANIKLCVVCDGVRRIRCSGCDGLYRINCKSCRGKVKFFTTETCPKCGGDPISCSKCHGEGLINCRKCKGEGKIKRFKKLITIWQNHVDDIIINETDLPNKLIRRTIGYVAFEEQSSMLSPLDHFPHKAVNEASANLIAKHKKEFHSKRTIQQKHQVRAVPVTEIQYCRKGKRGKFFIYGMKNEVYFPDYKKMFLCDCVIL